MAKQPDFRNKIEGLLGNEDGIMAVVFALLLPVFVVVAALAIDMGYSYWKRNMVQVDASASSLAGAGKLMDDGMYDPVNDVVIFATVDEDGNGVPDNLDRDIDGVPDGAVILNEALLYAEKNIPNEDILAVVDLHPGNWETTTRVFTSAGTWDPGTLAFDDSQQQAYDAATGTFTNVDDPVVPLNAVLAITRRADDGPNDNPLPLFLAAAVGLPEVNINTAAIAVVGAEIPTGYDGCLMAMNETEEDTFLAFGTADISAYDCDIYVNSNDECALAGNGVPVIEVGDDLTPGMIYVVGEACATNEGVVWNCNLPEGSEESCPQEGADEQIDPFAYTDEEPFKENSGLGTLQDLACGSQYVPEIAADYSNGSSLWEAYADTFEEADANNQTGRGNFKITGQTQVGLFDGGATTCTPDGGDPDSGLLADDGVTCVVPILYPAGDPNAGQPMIFGSDVTTSTGDWSWDIADQRFEFDMVAGAYCGGIEARGFGTVVFGEGDYILKGKEAVDPPIVGGPNPNEFDLRANVAVEGLNVAFYLADEYIEINWGGEADVALTGRQEPGDPLNGFLFYADPSNEGPHQFRGTPAGGYQGIMYFPEGDIVFKGTADSGLAQEDGSGLCTMLISDTVYFNGTTAFNASIDGCGEGEFEIPPVGAQLALRLVH